MPLVYLGGTRCHYQEWGNRTGPSVVLIHGLVGRGSVWAEVAQGLVAHGFRVVAPDLRGHGASDKPGDYSIPAYVGDVVGFIEELGLAPVHLVGHSLGGTIAWEVVASRPDMVRRLVIEDQHPEAAGDYWKTWQEWADSWPSRFDSRAEGIKFLHDNGRSMAWWVPSLVELPEGGWGWAFDIPGAVETIRQMYKEALWDRLAQVKAPTLLIRGEKSTHLTPEVAERMSRAIPDCRLLVMQGSDHWVHRNPQPYVDVVVRFLRELDGEHGRAHPQSICQLVQRKHAANGPTSSSGC